MSTTPMPCRAPRRGSSVRRVLTVSLAALLATLLAGTGLAPASATATPERAADAHRGAEARHDRATERWVRAMLRRLTLEEKVGQLMTGYAYGATADTADPRNVALYGVETPAEVVEEFHLGGVIYFAWTDSVNNPDQITALSNGLQRSALRSGGRVPLLVSTDQEQGVVTRFGPPATPLPGAMALGAGRSAEDAREAGAITGEELAAVGINTNYSPVADVNVNPLNPVIGVRSFSSDPGLVSEMVAAQVVGMQGDAGIVSTAKHFPGHGDTAVDSHVAFPVIDHTREEWEEIDAPPFQAAVDAGIDSIMTAHLAMPALDPSGDPATVSEPIITGILREEMGFDGVVITDSMEMAGLRERYGDAEAAVRVIEAGVDVLLMPAQPIVARDAILEAVDSGRLTEERIDESVTRVLRLKRERGVVADPMSDPAAVDAVVGAPEHMTAAQDITDRTVTAIRNDAGLLPLDDTDRDVLVTGWGVSTTASLGKAMTERGHDTTVHQTGARPTDTAIDEAVEQAAAHGLVVVLTQRAWDTAVTDPQGRQQRLVAELEAAGTPVLHVSVRDPYDVAYLPDTETSLATYSYTSVSMESLARVLHGEVSPAGKLPVDVPVAGDPGTVLYPFGHGLDW